MTIVFHSGPERQRIEAAGYAFAERKEQAERERCAQAAAEAVARDQARREAEIERRRRVVAEKVDAACGFTLRPAMAAIVRAVCEARQVDPLMVMSASRITPLAHARHEAMWRMRAELKLSYPAMGRFFHRDHSTVIHGIRMHAKRMAQNG